MFHLRFRLRSNVQLQVKVNKMFNYTVKKNFLFKTLNPHDIAKTRDDQLKIFTNK